MPNVELTDIDRRNGWTEETLAEYLNDRERSQMAFIDPHNEARRTRPMRADSKYSPFRWRR